MKPPAAPEATSRLLSAAPRDHAILQAASAPSPSSIPHPRPRRRRGYPSMPHCIAPALPLRCPWLKRSHLLTTTHEPLNVTLANFSKSFEIPTAAHLPLLTSSISSPSHYACVHLLQ